MVHRQGSTYCLTHFISLCTFQTSEVILLKKLPIVVNLAASVSRAFLFLLGFLRAVLASFTLQLSETIDHLTARYLRVREEKKLPV